MAKRIIPLLALAVLLGCTTTETALSAPVTDPATTTPTAAAGEPEPAADPVAEPTAAPAHDRTLLFFLNPKGRPCQLQDQILTEMGAGLNDKVTLQYVSVADPLSKPALYQYGIRSLPALILVDGEGQELHRFTPGIQPEATILAALD